jgi:hypothetical protein
MTSVSMSLKTRRILALIVAVVTIVLSTIWMAIGRTVIYMYAWWNLGQEIPLSKGGGARPNTEDLETRLYYFIFLGALLLAGGGAAALMILVPRTSFRHRSWIYFAFLAIVLPATWYNYSQREVVLRASIQAGLNLVLIFLSATTALWLSRAQSRVPDATVLKYISLALLLFGGVFVPSLFSLIWLLYSAGVLTEPQTKEISLGQITGMASIASVVIAWLNYSRDRKVADSEHSSNLIAKQ